MNTGRITQLTIIPSVESMMNKVQKYREFDITRKHKTAVRLAERIDKYYIKHKTTFYRHKTNTEHIAKLIEREL